MIKYDPKMFSSEYVYVKKITSNFIYITKQADGKAYEAHNSKKEKYRKQTVYKMRIHGNVSSQYFANNSLKEFPSYGRLTCIAFYGDIVISIEVKSMLSDVEDERWISAIDSVLSNVDNVIPKGVEVFINGKEIFWLDNENPKPFYLLKDKTLSLINVRYLPLSRIGVTLKENTSPNENKEGKENSQKRFNLLPETFKTIGNDDNFKSSKLSVLDFDNDLLKDESIQSKTFAFIKKAMVLNYNPEPEKEEVFHCYSPIIEFKKVLGRLDTKGVVDALTSIYDLEDQNKNNPTYLNINFLIKSGKYIGEQYGFKETEILKTPQLIKKIGICSLVKINKPSRKSFPINLLPQDGFAWLFRFIYKEKDLNKQRDLSNLFCTILQEGMVYEKSIHTNFKKGKSIEDVKLMDISEL